MKKIIYNTLILLIIGCSIASAQNRNLQKQTDRFVWNADAFSSKSIYDPATPELYDGTPYYQESFLLGNVFLENELLLSNAALRYNAIADEIEYKDSLNDEDEDAKALVKSKEIYATIMKDTYVFIPAKGYFIVIFDGSNFSLLKKVTKKYFPAKEAKNNYETPTIAKFSDRVAYHIYTKNGEMYELPNSKSKKLKAFGNSEKIVKDYIKKNDLDLNKEKDLKKVILYLDTVENASI